MTLLNSPFDSVAHSLALTLKYAKETGEKEICIPKGIYHVYASEASAPPICVANHGHNGFKATALSIENMNDVTIDGSGSEFILHGAMDFAIISRSRNVTVKNLTVRCADTCNFQGKVTESTEEYVKINSMNIPSFISSVIRCFRNSATINTRLWAELSITSQRLWSFAETRETKISGRR